MHNSNSSLQLDRRSLLAVTTVLGAAAVASCATSRQFSDASSTFGSIDQWIEQESIPFNDANFNDAVDRMMAALSDKVSVLGVGEALHGGEEHLVLRNRIFQRLVEAHGYTAITLEITHTRALIVNDYIRGRGPATYEEIQDRGFSYGSGLYGANRELVEWLKQYNANPANAQKLRFYGTLPSEQDATGESPRRAIDVSLAYLQSVDAASAARHREIMTPLVGADADWEAPAAAIVAQVMQRLMANGNARTPSAVPDRSLQFGISPRAQQLRLAVENLDFELKLRRPEFIGLGNSAAYAEALYYTSVARNVLALHAALARGESLGTMVSMRDAMAAAHIVYLTEREGDGKILVHLHNSHLRRSQNGLVWYEFWPTGAHLEHLLGARFAVVAGAVGVSEENFIATPEAGTVEARLLSRNVDCFLPVWRARGLPAAELAALPTRSGPTRPFVAYEQLSPRSLADIDVIAFFRSATHTRGMPPFPQG